MERQSKRFLIVEVGYQSYVYGSKTSMYFCLVLSKVHLEVRIAFFTQLIIVHFLFRELIYEGKKSGIK